jgi:hypothetical protein
MTEILLDSAILAGELLCRTLPFMILGVLVAELIVALGVVDKISFIARPITDFSHLRRECGASFLLAFGSPSAANAMLAQYRKKGFISKREMFLASIINSFPAILMHWRSMLPPLIPLLGIIGLAYFLILALTGLVKTALLMVASRFLLKNRDDCELALEERKRLPLNEAFKESWQVSKGTIKRMLLITVPTMFVVCILIKVGAFEALSAYLSGMSAYLPIPPSGLGIIAAQFGHSIAAYTVASGLLAAGEITGKEIILTLLVGSVLTSIVSMFRSTMPYYVGIFGLRTGLELMVLSSAIRNIIVIVFIVILALFW